MLSLPGPSSGVLVSLWLSLSATRQVRVPWCRANTEQEELLCSASEQCSALSSRFACSYMIPVLIFIFRGFLGGFHKQMFQPGLKHPWYRERKSSAGLIFLRGIAFSSKVSACYSTITCLSFP